MSGHPINYSNDWTWAGTDSPVDWKNQMTTLPLRYDEYNQEYTRNLDYSNYKVALKCLHIHKMSYSIKRVEHILNVYQIWNIPKFGHKGLSVILWFFIMQKVEALLIGYSSC